MSDFGLIIPEGWTTIDFNVMSTLPNELSTTAINNFITGGMINYITEELIRINLIPADKVVVDAKLFDSYFIVKLE